MPSSEDEPQYQANNDERREKRHRNANPSTLAIGDFHRALPEAFDEYLGDPCHGGTMSEQANFRNRKTSSTG